MIAGHIADQDYLVLNDGRILAVHGWAHPQGFAIGEIVFVPDGDGRYFFFNRGYRKPYVHNGKGISETNRIRVRAKTGSFYDTAQLFSTKSIVRTDDIEIHIKSSSFSDADAHESALAAIHEILNEASIMTGGATEKAEAGLTGSLRLNSSSITGRNAPHDIDVVFTSELSAVSSITRALNETLTQKSCLRVHEHGKGWRIRAHTKAGLLCPFFVYSDPKDAPIYDLTDTRTIEHDVEITGLVVDDTHNAYVPTYLTIRPLSASCQLSGNERYELPVIVSHLRARGDFFSGDYGRFKGALIEFSTESATRLALSVVDGNSSKLLTPPWLPF